MKTLIAALAALAFGSVAAAQDEAPTGAAVPDWYVEHVDYMTRDGGRWVADNSEYRSDEETADAYVIAVGHLSDRLKGGGPIRANWPRAYGR